MKSKTTVLALVGAVFGLTGCLDLKETVVTGVTGAYYGTPDGANAAINGGYSQFKSWAGQQHMLALYLMGSDTWETADQTGNDKTLSEYDTNWTPNTSNPELNSEWQNKYAAINTDNTAIKYIGSSTTIPEPTRSIRLAEARFMRAWNYFLLVRTFGDIPMPLQPTEGDIDVSGHRTPKDSVYNAAIIPDLLFAVNNLPLKQTDDGRATKGAAQMLLSEVYLTRAAAGDFDQAVTLTSAVISSGMYRLNPSYYDLWCGSAYWEVCENTTKKQDEWIFWVPYNGNSPYDGGQTYSLMFSTRYDVLAGLARALKYGRPWDHARATRHMLDLYNRDTDRRYSTNFQTVWLKPNGVDTAMYMPGTATVPAAYVGKPYKVYGEDQYTVTIHPSTMKWLDDKMPGGIGAQNAIRTIPLYRLGEAYLLRAEANIRKGNASAAIPDINVLRVRAAFPGKDNTMSAAEVAAFNAAPLDFLLDERERELVGEEMRWFVLTRTGKLVERVQKYNAPAAPNIKAYHVLRPIPQRAIDRTQGGLPQNPGY